MLEKHTILSHLSNQFSSSMRILWIFSLSFVLTFSSAIATQSIQEEEVKTEERCLVKSSSFQLTFPEKEEPGRLSHQVKKHFISPLASATSNDATKKFVLHLSMDFL